MDLEQIKIPLMQFFMEKAFPSVLILFITWVIAAAFGIFMGKVIKDVQEKRKIVYRFILRTGRYVIWCVGLISLMGTMGINISAMVAGLGLTGFALGFALKDALSNLIAGILLILYSPFSPGDRISVSRYEGTLIDMNLRYISIEKDNGELVLVPNSIVFSQVIIVKRKREDA